jgi:putative tryptophan/tyrosine transport system substrate-binding protein
MIYMYRSFVIMIFFAVASTGAQAQPRIPRVAVLIPELGRSQSQAVKGLRDEFKQLGYQDGKHISFEMQNAKGDRANLQTMAADLVSRKADVILTTGTRATQVATSATRDIPIVFIHALDPSVLGLANNTDKPANITGVAGFSLQMTERRLVILKDIIPQLQRVHVFYDLNDRYSRGSLAIVKPAAAKLSVQVVEHGVKSAEELKATVGGVQNEKGDALFHLSDDLVESDADFIFDWARKKKLPSMFSGESWAVRGAMAAYGPSYYEMGRQAARLVEMIMKGHKPKSLEIQRANKFELILNYRTAKLIGVTLSPEVLKKADKVIR